jgi:hypothetical protein
MIYCQVNRNIIDIFEVKIYEHRHEYPELGADAVACTNQETDTVDEQIRTSLAGLRHSARNGTRQKVWNKPNHRKARLQQPYRRRLSLTG